MEVTYRTTAEDWIVFAERELRRTKKLSSWSFTGITSAAVWVVALVLGGRLLLLGYSTHDQGNVVLGSVVMATAGTAMCILVFLPFVVRHQKNTLLRKNARQLAQAGEFGEVKLLMTDNLLVATTAKRRSELHWRGIDRIEEVGDYTFIYVSPISAYVLPKHGFASDEEYQKAVGCAWKCFQNIKIPVVTAVKAK